MSRSHNDHGKSWYFSFSTRSFKDYIHMKIRAMNKRLIDELEKTDLEDEELIENAEAKVLGEENKKTDPWIYD